MLQFRRAVRSFSRSVRTILNGAGVPSKSVGSGKDIGVWGWLYSILWASASGATSHNPECPLQSCSSTPLPLCTTTPPASLASLLSRLSIPPMAAIDYLLTEAVNFPRASFASSSRTRHKDRARSGRRRDLLSFTKRQKSRCDNEGACPRAHKLLPQTTRKTKVYELTWKALDSVAHRHPRRLH